LDGSNVGVARIDDKLYPLTRSGYIADTSPWQQHIVFYGWVFANQDRFMEVLRNGERLVGEWLMQAHGTRYDLKHEPFVPFDLMVEEKRAYYAELSSRLKGCFTLPYMVHCGDSIPVAKAMDLLGEYGHHGATDPVEGLIYRVERDKATGKKDERVRVVDFLVKYVRPDKEDGIYLPKISGGPPIWNWRPAFEKELYPDGWLD
jgi:hypothetical protein